MRILPARTMFVCASLLLSFLTLGAAMPQTKLTVQVSAAETGRMIEGASVIVRFRPGSKKIKLNNVRTSWETKTNQQGSVSIPEIPQGQVAIQVIAQHYQTFGDLFQLDQTEQTITVKLNPPQKQYSEDSKPGVPDFKK
jgi:hypothetical protein